MMALAYHYELALAKTDADGTSGGNTVGGAVVTLQDLSGNTIVMYDDESASGGSTSKVTRATGDDLGSVEFWVEEGDYNLYINGSYKKRINVRPPFDMTAPQLVGSLSDLRNLLPRYDGDVALMSSREDGEIMGQRLFKWVENSDATLNYENVVTSLVATGAWLAIDNYTATKNTPNDMTSRLRQNIADEWSGSSINILGDSISWGSNAPDVYNDSYVGVLRKLIHEEYGSDNIGFISIKGENTNGAGTYNDFHAVTTSGAWSERTLSDASTLISGYSRYSSSGGAYLDVSAPVETSKFRVMYRQQAGGGTFRVSNNGGSTWQTTVDSSGAENGAAITPLYNMVDSGAGNCDIRIEVVSGLTEILGIQYVEQFDDAMVNNFSHPGRKAQHVENAVIDAACSGRTLIWALGFNDKGATGTDQDEVIAVLDYLRDTAQSTGVKLYVIDLNWGFNKSNWLRQELDRVAKSVDGAVYIPLPDLISQGGFAINSTSLQSTYDFLSDGSHPNPDGHKAVAEVIAKVMGLSITSKAVQSKINSSETISGTFTPTIEFATNGDFSPTYTIQSGEYFVSGNTVRVIGRLDFDVNAYTTASGNILIGGLPYTVKGQANQFYYPGSIITEQVSLPANGIQFVPIAVRNTSQLQISTVRDGLSRVSATAAQLPASTTSVKMFFSVEYPIV